MDKKHLSTLRKFEVSFFKEFDTYIYDFSDQLKVEIISESEELSWLKITLINSELNRKIETTFTTGINFEHNIFYDFMFYIYNGENSFSIKDYCAHKKITSPILKDFFIEVENLEKEISLFFKGCLEFLKKKEVEKMLYSDFWIDIPSDFSPYK